VTRHSQGSKCAQVSTVFESNETERYNDEQDSFLVDMPSEEEGSIATKSDCSDEGVPGWIQEELDQGKDHEEKSQGESGVFRDLR